MLKQLVLIAITNTICYGSIIYDFTGVTAELGATASIPVAFRLTVPTFIDPPLDAPLDQLFVSFSCMQLDSETNCGNGVNFSNQSVLGAYSAQLGFGANNFASYGFFFPTGAFRTLGTFQTGGQSGSLTNTGTLTVNSSGVPEPATGSFVVIAFLALRCIAGGKK